VLGCRGGNRRTAPCASVDAIKEPAGGLPGKKIGIHFQGGMNPGRRALARLPELEVPQDFFYDRGMFNEADLCEASHKSICGTQIEFG